MSLTDAHVDVCCSGHIIRSKQGGKHSSAGFPSGGSGLYSPRGGQAYIPLGGVRPIFPSVGSGLYSALGALTSSAHNPLGALTSSAHNPLMTDYS